MAAAPTPHRPPSCPPSGDAVGRAARSAGRCPAPAAEAHPDPRSAPPPRSRPSPEAGSCDADTLPDEQAAPALAGDAGEVEAVSAGHARHPIQLVRRAAAPPPWTTACTNRAPSSSHRRGASSRCTSAGCRDGERRRRRQSRRSTEFSVPARRPRSWPPPRCGSSEIPARTSAHPDARPGPPTCGPRTAMKSAPAASATSRRPAAWTASPCSRAPRACAISAAAATGCTTPFSLFTSISATSAGSSDNERLGQDAGRARAHCCRNHLCVGHGGEERVVLHRGDEHPAPPAAAVGIHLRPLVKTTAASREEATRPPRVPPPPDGAAAACACTDDGCRPCRARRRSLRVLAVAARWRCSRGRSGRRMSAWLRRTRRNVESSSGSAI